MRHRALTPLVLALDTTHEHGSLALARGGEVLEEVAIYSTTGFSQVVFGHLQALLDRQNVTLGQVDCFAAASGPGSFTGVRVALSCIKGLAEASGRPAVGVSNLQAVAAFGAGALRAPVMDARRGDIYGAVYDSGLRVVIPEMVAKVEDWLKLMPAGPIEFLSPDFGEWGAQLPGERHVTARAMAGAIARIAADKYANGEAGDPAALDANYVRRSDAELFWKEA